MRLREYALPIALAHLLVYATILFDIPVFRQISVFVYLLFIPGFVFLGVLKIEKISFLDLTLYSLGLSIALVMFVGLFVNEIYPILGISQPLSTIPLFLTMSVLTLVLFVVGCKRDIAITLSSISFGNFTKGSTVITVLLILLPIFSFVSAIYVKAAIPILPMLVAALFIACLSAKLVPVQLYPLLIFSVSLSLTVQFTLMSTHVMGTDSPLEYFVYKLTATNGRWIPADFGLTPQSAYNSMLSITILPTIYSVLSNLDGELVFKVLYPVVFSFVPMILYRILAKENWRLGALLSALFFISSPIVFYGVNPLSLNRQIVAELFLLLSVLLLLEKQFSTRNNRLIFIIFGAALAVSHYALMIIYLFFLVSVFAIERIRGRRDSVLNGGMVLLASSFSFSWHLLIPSGVINSMSNAIHYIIARFYADLYSPTARASDIFAAGPVQTISSTINWTLFYVAHFFILIGIIAVLLNRQDTRLDSKYRLMIILSALLLFLAIAVPNLAPTLNFHRYYAITFLFLAPCFVFGSRILFLLPKKVLTRITGNRNGRAKSMGVSILLIGIVVSAYFLSQSGFINHVTGGSPISWTLEWDRIRTSTDIDTKMNFYIDFVPEQDVASATWLSKFMANDALIYSDFTSMDLPLRNYGLIPDDRLLLLTNETKLEPNSYIYLRYFNVVDGFITPSIYWVFNTTEISSTLNYCNCLYANGGSMVYGFPSS